MTPDKFNTAASQKIELPELFVHYLQENHGLNLNAKPVNLSETWIKFRYTRNRFFNKADYWYNLIRKRLQTSQEALSRENELLYDKWNITIKVPFDLSALHSNDWSKPAKAIPTLKSVFEKLPSPYTIRKESNKAEQTAREQWVNELLQTAHENNANFIVLKNPNYEPYEENMKQFNAAVQNRTACSLRTMCVQFAWLCCPVEELSQYLLEDPGKSGLSKNNCTVDYILS